MSALPGPRVRLLMPLLPPEMVEPSPAVPPAGGHDTLRDGDDFTVSHLWLPLLAFAVASVLLMGLGGDLGWADRLYALQVRHWALRDHWLTAGLIHQLGRNLSSAAWLGVAVTALVAWRRPALARWRRPLAYLLTSTLLATTVVALLKARSNVDCPWDLLRYGGLRPYLGVFSARPPELPHAACFPAGHASGGYAWLSLYFFFAVTAPQWRRRGLLAALGLGALFGFAQQLRGAHFLSHDVWTLMICWIVALSTYLLWFPRPAATADASRAPSTARSAVAE